MKRATVPTVTAGPTVELRRQVEFPCNAGSDTARHQFGQCQADLEFSRMNDRATTSAHGGVGLACDLVSLRNAALGEQTAGAVTRRRTETGCDRPGTANGSGDTGATQFRSDGFGERDDKRFGSVVRRHERSGLKPGRRSDIEYTATLSRDHGGQQSPRQFDERSYIDCDLIQLFLRVEFPELAIAPDPGVVDQPLDLQIARLQRAANFCARARLAQVSNYNFDDDTARPQIGSDLFEDVATPRNQHQVMLVSSEFVSQREAQPAGSTSNERICHISHYHQLDDFARLDDFNYDRCMSHDPRNPWGPAMPAQPPQPGPPEPARPGHPATPQPQAYPPQPQAYPPQQPYPPQPSQGYPQQHHAPQQPYPPQPSQGYPQQHHAPQQPYPPQPGQGYSQQHHAPLQPGQAYPLPPANQVQPASIQPPHASSQRPDAIAVQRKTHLISTVNAPAGTGFGAMAALSLRRAFRLRIEPNEVLEDERFAMLRAKPPITNENQQAFLAWRRSVLFMAALLMVPVALLHAVENLDFDSGTPEGWKTVSVIAFLVEAGFAVFLWMQVPKWTAWRTQSRALAIGWVVYFFTPFLVFLYPLADALLEMQLQGADASAVPADALRQIKVAAGAMIGAGALLSLAPKVISLLQGVIRASIATKTLFPGATAPGWTMVIAAPLYMIIFYMFVLLPYHFSGSGLVGLGLLLVLIAKASLVRAGLGLTKPMTDEVARAATKRALSLWMVLLVCGAGAIIAGLWDTIKDAKPLTFINFGLAMGANILVLTLIATDGIIAALNRARGTSPEEETLSDQAAAQVAAFTRDATTPPKAAS